MTNFWEQNRSFIITLGIVVGSITLFMILKSSHLGEFLRANLLYSLSLVLIASIPWFLVQKLEWAPTRVHKASWFFFLMGVTLYYALTAKPNWMGLFGDLLTGYFNKEKLGDLLFSTATYIGLTYLYYFLLSTLKNDFFYHEGRRITLFTYTMWMASFLIYLNATISIVNPLFHRPF